LLRSLSPGGNAVRLPGFLRNRSGNSSIPARH